LPAEAVEVDADVEWDMVILSSHRP
jgi:hypothetical protein